jgi:glycosyltransferase involved in cell wall biosynthesis
MVEAYEKVGGPPRLVRLIVASPLSDKYDFHVLSYSISGFNLKAVLALRRQLVQLKPDIVHVHGLKSDGFLATVAARLARVAQILVTIHGSTADASSDYQTSNQKLRQWLVGHVLEPATLRLADAVYCVCDAMKNQPRIRKHANTRLHDTIHNGVQVKPVINKTNSLRKSFGFVDDDLILLYTGRIARDKGLEVLAAAIDAIVREELPPATNLRDRIKLLLVGDGRAFDEIRACFQSLIQTNHVVMAGKRDDIDDLNAMADIFVFPSFHENLPFSLLEAMNAGRAIVATAVGGNVEVVEDGQTGLLVPARDTTALANGILRLATDGELRKVMGEAGRKRLATHFSAETVIRKTDSLYRSLLSDAKTVKQAIAPFDGNADPARPIPMES